MDSAAEMLTKSAGTRAKWLIEEINETKSVWGLLGSDGWVMMDDGEQSCLPVWAMAEHALSWQRVDMPDCKPALIELTDFILTWLPGLEKNGIQIALFPTGTGQEGIIVTADEMRLQLDDGGQP